MARVVCLGEIMLRLSPPGNKRLIQSKCFDIMYGGSESNVAVSLANFGHEACFVTKLPNHLLGKSAVAELKKYNVHTEYILYGGERMGVYYLENGASVRSSNVVYDRKYSSFSQSLPEEYDWNAILEGADLFHTSGISPILGGTTGEIVLQALKTAKKKGMVTSFDLNYRSRLWEDRIEEKQQMMSELMKYVDICFGNARDAARVLGYSDGKTDFLNGSYADCISEDSMQGVRRKYGFTCLISSDRTSLSASDNVYSALAVDENGWYYGNPIELHIVDRVGSGDAFAAGFLHGVLSDMTKEDSLEFAIASAALKHTVPGDISLFSCEEVQKVLTDHGNGRVVR